MPEKPDERQQYTVACRCGAPITLDAASFGRPRACASCGQYATVLWGVDPMGRERIPVVTVQSPPRATRGRGKPPDDSFRSGGPSRPVPREAGGKPKVVEKAPAPKEVRPKKPKARKPRAAASPRPVPKEPPLRVRVRHDAPFFGCACGKRLPVAQGAGGKPVPCPACGRRHVVEKMEAPAPQAPVPPPAPRPAAEPPRPKPPTLPLLRPGEFLCKCGTIQPPRTSRTGKEFTCIECGRKGHLEQKIDPATGEVVFDPVFTSGPPGRKA